MDDTSPAVTAPHVAQLYPKVDGAYWDAKRWPHFSAAEIACQRGACPHCGGSVFVDSDALDALERLRANMGPLTIASGHRCAKHNADVGGAGHSQHLTLAFDIALGSYSRADMYGAAHTAGFRGFGFMRSGLHVDARPHYAFWTYGQTSARLWAGIYPEGTRPLSNNPET